MHIEFERIDKPLSEQHKAHLQQCDECRSQYQMLQQLQADAGQLGAIAPPAGGFERIRPTLSKPAARGIPLWQTLCALAATVMLSMFGYLMWNNYRLQTQLDLVLQVNQSLELQLHGQTRPNIRQAQLLRKVEAVDLRLHTAYSGEQKLELLKQRQKLINDMLNDSKGAPDEFSI